MTEHPLERPECPCGGEHYYADCPNAGAPPRFTVRVVLLNPREGVWCRYNIADIDEDGCVVDAAWVGSREKVRAWMERDALTGDPATIWNIGRAIDRGELVSEREHLRATQTAALPRDPYDLASEWA